MKTSQTDVTGYFSPQRVMPLKYPFINLSLIYKKLLYFLSSPLRVQKHNQRRISPSSLHDH